MYFPEEVRTPLTPLVWLRHWLCVSGVLGEGSLLSGTAFSVGFLEQMTCGRPTWLQQAAQWRGRQWSSSAASTAAC